MSGGLRGGSVGAAEARKRPVKFLPSSQTSEDGIAREIAAKDKIQDGLVCVLSCVEPCWSFQIYRNREQKKLELLTQKRKCLFLYHYWMHPKFGFMNALIQTWFPFPIQIGMNGREWLGRQMEAEGIEYAAQGNCFPWIAHWAKAQRLMDQQLRTGWPKMLGDIGKHLNPIHDEIFEKYPVSYYWTTYQSEWAIDVVFREAAVLRRLYPRLLLHGVTTFSSTDVMRYLGKRPLLSGEIPQHFSGDIKSTLKHREDGVRNRHVLNRNYAQLNDKA